MSSGQTGSEVATFSYVCKITIQPTREWRLSGGRVLSWRPLPRR
nr:MAG TPA: hypothetical protein [Bacteriophage sp.]